MKLNKYNIIFGLVLFISCNHIDKELKTINPIRIDTVRTDNKTIVTPYINGIKNGYQEIYSVHPPELIRVSNYLNDTLDGLTILWNNDYGTHEFYDNGVLCFTRQNLYDIEQKLKILRFNQVKYETKENGDRKVVAYRMGEIILTLDDTVITRNSDYYLIKNSYDDTVSVNEVYNLEIDFYNYEIPTKKYINLYLKDNNQKVIDTILTEENNNINIKILTKNKGRNKIRGSITYEYMYEEKKIEEPFPFYHNFYVR